MPNIDPLQNVRLSFQCPMDWNAMKGDETNRFCEQCQKLVHNLSEYTEEEARMLICGGNVCVRVTKDEQGKVITKRSTAAALLVAASVSCQTYYDKDGNPVQTVDPGCATVTVSTTGVVAPNPNPNPNSNPSPGGPGPHPGPRDPGDTP